MPFSDDENPLSDEGELFSDGDIDGGILSDDDALPLPLPLPTPAPAAPVSAEQAAMDRPHNKMELADFYRSVVDKPEKLRQCARLLERYTPAQIAALASQKYGG